jgi:hypothetical protein
VGSNPTTTASPVRREYSNWLQDKISHKPLFLLGGQYSEEDIRIHICLMNEIIEAIVQRAK